jgi:hypothetical protein
MFILQLLCVALFVGGPMIVITNVAYREIDSPTVSVFIIFLTYAIWGSLSVVAVIKTIWEGLDYDDIFEFIGALFSNLTYLIGL